MGSTVTRRSTYFSASQSSQEGYFGNSWPHDSFIPYIPAVYRILQPPCQLIVAIPDPYSITHFSLAFVSVVFPGRRVLGIPTKGSLVVGEGCDGDESLHSSRLIPDEESPDGIVHVQSIGEILETEWLATATTTGSSSSGATRGMTAGRLRSGRGTSADGFLTQQQHFRHAGLKKRPVVDTLQTRGG